MTEGFYKYHEQELYYAPNFVCHRDFELFKENKDGYQYPVYGWYWFDSEDDAMIFFNISKLETPIE